MQATSSQGLIQHFNSNLMDMSKKHSNLAPMRSEYYSNIKAQTLSIDMINMVTSNGDNKDQSE